MEEHKKKKFFKVKWLHNASKILAGSNVIAVMSYNGCKAAASLYFKYNVMSHFNCFE